MFASWLLHDTLTDDKMSCCVDDRWGQEVEEQEDDEEDDGQ